MRIPTMHLVALALACAAVGAVPVRQARVAESIITFPLYDLGGYMWYTTLAVGTPPQLLNFTVDTGSSDLIVSGTDCGENCGIPLSTAYNGTASSTMVPVDCGTKTLSCGACVRGRCASSVDYGGSINETFTLVEEEVTVGSGLVKLLLGDVYNINMSGPTGSTRLSRNFAAKALASSSDDFFYPEGMWGLSYASLSSDRAAPFFDTIVAQQQLRNQFFMTLAAPAMLTLGSLPQSPGRRIPQVTKPLRFYTLYLRDFLVAGTSVGANESVYNVPGAGCIVDSGTSVPSLPQPAHDGLRARLQDLCKSHDLHGFCDVPAGKTLLDGQCFNMTDAQRAAFPTMTYRFATEDGHEDIDYLPDAYLTSQYYCNHPSEVGLAMTPDTDFTVVGATVMKQYTVGFDRETSHVSFHPITQH